MLQCQCKQTVWLQGMTRPCQLLWDLCLHPTWLPPASASPPASLAITAAREIPFCLAKSKQLGPAHKMFLDKMQQNKSCTGPKSNPEPLLHPPCLGHGRPFPRSMQVASDLSQDTPWGQDHEAGFSNTFSIKKEKWAIVSSHMNVVKCCHSPIIGNKTHPIRSTVIAAHSAPDKADGWKIMA